MKLVVQGRNIDITDALTDHAEEKMRRLVKYLSDGAMCDLELSVEKNPSIAENQVAEATIHTKGPVIRGREASSDMYASIDLLVDKLERQVKKYREKMVARRQKASEESVVEQGFTLPEEEETEDADLPQIVKVKQFMVKPMTPEEAALQLELVGHDFFVFTNVDTEDTAVVYKRRDGDYGLIEPQK